MVLEPSAFRLHRSLRKEIRQLLRQERIEIRMDHDFPRVIRACASTPRHGQSGTWILPAMMAAYTRLHHSGMAHSVEVWIDDELVGGLYCVSIGAMVFGESMFSRRTNASKMALAALVAFCRTEGIALIDCQQQTSHLASLGACAMPRASFCARLRQAISNPAPAWSFQPVYWQTLLDDTASHA
jgi:leucyl/phenylalanyl-tRNA---protein transferase